LALEKRNPTVTGGVRFLEGLDLLGGDQHQDSEIPSQLQARRIARLFFVAPETAATIARLAYGTTQ
jgi:hypothetical protein